MKYNEILTSNETEEKKEQPVVIKPTNPAASWDDTVNVLGAQAEAEKVEKSLPQWNTGANFAIRNSLENDFGIDGSRISYKDGNVLLDGNFLMKAENNVDGTTYAKDYDTVLEAVSDYVGNNGLVGIRDYAASSGTAVNVSWNGAEKTVSINGQTVKPTAIIDGKAYIPKSQIDAVLAQERDTAGTSYSNIYNETENKYGAGVDSLYDKYVNSEEFNYVPENDPAYQAYMKTARKAIEDEYANNMAASRFRTGGVGSTGQMLQAAAIREGAVDDLVAARAQFEQNAYERYLNDLSVKKDKYLTADDRFINTYNRLSDVNAKDKQDFYNAHTFDNQMQASDLELRDMNTESELYNKYASGYADMEYGDTVRNYNISEEFAYPFARQEYAGNTYELIKQREYLKSLGLTEAQIEAVFEAYMKR